MVPRLRSRDPVAVVAELCSVLHRAQRVKDLLPFYNAVISRETLSNTATFPGWAMPHARSNDLEHLSFAVGLTSQPLTWFGNVGNPVNVAFLFAVPENETASYLRLISGLAKFSQDPLRVQRLLQATDGRTMFELLQKFPLRQPRPVAAERARLRFP
jgi:mannitol/fructose-specific phosphotransferase system IIA component (Ntr-type)